MGKRRTREVCIVVAALIAAVGALLLAVLTPRSPKHVSGPVPAGAAVNDGVVSVHAAPPESRTYRESGRAYQASAGKAHVVLHGALTDGVPARPSESEGTEP